MESYEIKSEEIEPILGFILVRMAGRTRQAKLKHSKDSVEYQHEKEQFDYCIDGMRRMVLSIPECVHAHIAISNEIQRAIGYILK